MWADKKWVIKGSLDKVSVDKVSVEKVTVDKVTVDKVTVDTVSIDKKLSWLIDLAPLQTLKRMKGTFMAAEIHVEIVGVGPLEVGQQGHVQLDDLKLGGDNKLPCFENITA